MLGALAPPNSVLAARPRSEFNLVARFLPQAAGMPTVELKVAKQGFRV